MSYAPWRLLLFFIVLSRRAVACLLAVRQQPARRFAAGDRGCGANGEPLANDYGFHTDLPTNPRWMVDLLAEHRIEEVAIVNRLAQQQRFRTVRIESHSIAFPG
jgi:hypothetical protein